MRKLLVFLLVFAAMRMYSQDNAVKWIASLRQSHGESFTIILKAEIDQGWWIYDDNLKAELAAPQIIFESGNIAPEGKPTTESKSVIITDPVFGPGIRIYKTGLVFEQKIRLTGNASAILLRIESFASDGKTFLPFNSEIKINTPGRPVIIEDLKIPSFNIEQPLAACGDTQNNAVGKGLLTILLIGFGGGLIALLTPCVFPMIPVTVSYFSSKSNSKQQAMQNGILYGAYIFIIYLLASVPFHLLNLDPQLFNTISTNAWVNVFFFIVFIFFALSFFGLLEIRLPSSIANNTGNKGGIFFMALTLAVVSFSCTGPILGSLLVGSLSSNGGAWQLTAGMGGFGLALALPFALFAIFPHWLKTLPKSGSWMETVKKSLAFVELALAIKFLSNADLVEHWGILKREVFIGLWILIALSLSFYLLGIFDKKRWLVNGLQTADNLKKTKLSAPRIGFGVLCLLFALYLIPGISQSKYANLKFLSGFPPPLSYSVYGKNNSKDKGLAPDVINDYQKALQLAKKENKVLLIDFTGWACVNCRKMEELVWTKSSIQELIKNNCILVSLYVDDRKKLPDGETVGEKWAAFQAENFKVAAQPLYVLLSPDEKLLNHPAGYTPDENKYKDWLECGINAINKKKQ